MISNDNPGGNGYSSSRNNGSGNSHLNGSGGGHAPDSRIPQESRVAPIPPDISRIQRALMETEVKGGLTALDYLRLLWRGKWIIVTFFLIATLITAYYTYSLPFIYESSLQILVNEKETPTLFGPNNWQSARNLNKELQLLTSRPILDSTAARLLRVRYLDQSLKDSVIPVVAAAESALKPMLKRSSPEHGEMMLVQHLGSTIQKMTTVKPAKDADIIQISCKTGDPLEAALITNTYAEVYMIDNLVQNRAKALKIRDFISGQLASTRDSLSKQEMNMKNYQEAHGILGPEVEGKDLTSAHARLDDEAKRAQIELSTVEERLNVYRNQLVDIDSTIADEISSALPPYFEIMQNQIAALEAQLQVIQAENQVGASVVWYEGQVKSRRAKIDELKGELHKRVESHKLSKLGSIPVDPSRTGNNTPTAPLVALKHRIFEDEIAAQALRAKLRATNGAKGEVERRMTMVPEQALEMTRLAREKKGLENIYIQLDEEFNKNVLAVQKVFPDVRVFEPAQPNPKPISPNRASNITIGGIMGLMLGIGVVLLIAYADTTIHSPDDLEKHGFTVLTAISPIDQNKLSLLGKGQGRGEEIQSAHNRLSPHLISQLDPKSPVAESYRSLRTAIQYASVEREMRVLLVTSSIPQEGKSTTATNLAIVFAHSGSRTLLLDCDLRRPIAHSIFGMGKEPGLVNYLIGNSSLDDALRPTGIPYLDVLSSGSIPPNPSELLGSRRMEQVLDELKERYDTIVIDSPPVSAVTDAVILSTRADATIAVVRAHKTKMEFLEKIREELERVSTSLMGVVLNDFDATQSYGSTYKYYRYYKYYSYYGQPNEEGRRKERRAETASKNISA